ncbi:hypothetical protein [Sphingomonas sp. MMS24-J13]|uniref:hypothetical protein n=1 Tax=Sphingomonas sp. MMS24-J13 TaxID=3238686 RepID=UPI00384D748E
MANFRYSCIFLVVVTLGTLALSQPIETLQETNDTTPLLHLSSAIRKPSACLGGFPLNSAPKVLFNFDGTASVDYKNKWASFLFDGSRVDPKLGIDIKCEKIRRCGRMSLFISTREAGIKLISLERSLGLQRFDKKESNPDSVVVGDIHAPRNNIFYRIKRLPKACFFSVEAAVGSDGAARALKITSWR